MGIYENKCKFSQVQQPCAFTEPTPEECRACLKKSYEQHRCATCGGNTYFNFLTTSNAHSCDILAQEKKAEAYRDSQDRQQAWRENVR